MVRTAELVLLSIVFTVSGCAVKQAQNPQEFRKMTASSMYAEQETFTINNAYSNAVSNVKRRANECLDTGIVLTTYRDTGAKMGEQTLTYTPTLVMGKERTELSVQMDVSGDGMIAGKVPENGLYILVTDLSEAPGNKTKIDVYRTSYRGIGAMVSSIKNWASGESMDCPDLTK